MSLPHRVRMWKCKSCWWSALLAVTDFAWSKTAYSSESGRVPARFEGRQTHPIGLAPGGSSLRVVNTAGARLSVFSIADPCCPTPLLDAEISVGLEPVSLRARTDDEVWVVNEASESISIVSLRRRLTVANLTCADEPADVVFAEGWAFVSCARNSLLRVFDVGERRQVAVIPLDGIYPRAQATNADGTRVFAAFQLSGDRTTVLPAAKADPQPVPANPNLPPPPGTAEIVNANDVRVAYTVLDHDVAAISVTDLKVLNYVSDVGTCLFDLAFRPDACSGEVELWVANTAAWNRIRCEPNLRRHVADNRLTRMSLVSGIVSPFDLSSGVDHAVLPNSDAQATALAQPTAVIFSSDGSQGWVAAYGSDRVVKFDPMNGDILSRVDVRTPPFTGQRPGTGTVRGPRGLAFHEASGRLYVLNKLSDSITVIATGTSTVESEVDLATSDPFPTDVREGRGVLFDARLSGNGLASCATCHPDVDRDGLAWDLGNPSGEMLTILGANLAFHDSTPRPRELPPMKGPMTTQTLRGLVPGQPHPWRGDRPTLDHFNATFADLLGGTLRPKAEIDALQAYQNTPSVA